jgi:hypothetical protein
MNDRELLKDAAKAAGINLVFDPDGWPRDCTGMAPAMNVFSAKLWNPIDDDGNALRLAVKLRISVWVDSSDACCSWVPEGQHPFAEGMEQLAEEITNNDPYAAARRAIVRAAAEIGRSKT